MLDTYTIYNLMLLNTSLYTTLSVLLLSWLCSGRSTEVKYILKRPHKVVCPWENTDVCKLIPTYSTNCPWDLLIIIVKASLTGNWSLLSSTNNIVMINLIDSKCSTHGLLFCFILLHISNGLVSTSLVGHVLYSADLMSAICIPHFYLMVYRYIYSRYSSIFLTLYQLYHFLSSSTPISSSSLYLSIAT